MRNSKGQFIKGSKLGFQKGHSPYNKKLEEWRKNGGITWNKGLTGEKSHSFGKIFSEERRKKISEKLKGNKNAFGYKHSEKTKEKMRQKVFSLETRRKLSEAQRGENHWRWNQIGKPLSVICVMMQNISNGLKRLKREIKTLVC